MCSQALTEKLPCGIVIAGAWAVRQLLGELHKRGPKVRERCGQGSEAGIRGERYGIRRPSRISA